VESNRYLPKDIYLNVAIGSHYFGINSVS